MSSSARDLHSIFLKLRDSRNNKQNTAMRAVLDEVLQNPFKEENTFTKYSKLCQLVRETRKEVEELFPDNPYLTSWMPSVEQNLIGIKMDTRAFDSLSWLSTQAIDGVQTCANFVEKELARGRINQDDLQRFYSEVKTLFREVEESSDVDEDTKKFLLKHLRSFISSIQDSCVMGVKPVKSATESAFTEAILNPDRTKKVEGNKLGKRFFKILHELVLITSLATNIVVFIEALGLDSNLPQLTGEVLEGTSENEKESAESVTDVSYKVIGKEEVEK